MSELDEAWALGLAQAEARARAHGRTDIADYLALRSSNDLKRKVASDWLFTLFTVAAGQANHDGASLEISRDTAHSFKVEHAVMVGQRLDLIRGVRRLRIEVGWPRAPRDGFIRGGGLACANIKHLGMKSANDELRLMLSDAGTPSWVVEPKKAPRDFHEVDVKKHLAILLSDSINPAKHS